MVKSRLGTQLSCIPLDSLQQKAVTLVQVESCVVSIYGLQNLVSEIIGHVITKIGRHFFLFYFFVGGEWEGEERSGMHAHTHSETQIEALLSQEVG